MSRHHEKLIKALTEPEPKQRRTEPRTCEEIKSFVRGFGLSAAAMRQVVEAWAGDVQLAREAGWADGYDSAEDYYSRD
jgi:hypothetical protein